MRQKNGQQIWNISIEVAHMVARMTHPDPDIRPTIDDVLMRYPFNKWLESDITNPRLVRQAPLTPIPGQAAAAGGRILSAVGNPLVAAPIIGGIAVVAAFCINKLLN